MIRNEEAVVFENAIREVTRTEISKVLRRIGDRLTLAYSGGRFDGSPEADQVIAYLGELLIEEGNQI